MLCSPAQAVSGECWYVALVISPDNKFSPLLLPDLLCLEFFIVIGNLILRIAGDFFLILDKFGEDGRRFRFLDEFEMLLWFLQFRVDLLLF